MPVHDWTRLPDGIFHHFHLSWIVEIKRAVRRLLPADCYVMVEQIVDDLVIPDVLVVKAATPTQESEDPPTGTAPPKRSLVIRHTSDNRIVAMIEVISRGNKSSQHAIRSFLDKAAVILDSGINLLLVDVHPPGPRDPQGVHGAILNEIGTTDYKLDSQRPLAAVVYIGGLVVEAFVRHFAVGEPLPAMPLFLTAANYVQVPLDSTYMAAWEDVPRHYQAALLGSV